MKYNKKIQGADYIFTGEGKSDHQTLHGKAPFGVLLCAKEYEIPTVLLSGCIDEADRQLLAEYFQEIYSVVGEEISVEQAMNEALSCLTQRACEAFSKIVN